MEKPIIATNQGGACDLIEDGKTGWLVPPQDEKALAKVLDQALTLPKKELVAMGKRERTWAETHFSKIAMLSKTIAVYKEVISDLATTTYISAFSSQPQLRLYEPWDIQELIAPKQCTHLRCDQLP